MLNMASQTAPSKHPHLVISDSAMKNFVANDTDQLHIMQDRDMSFDKAMQALSDCSKESYSNITLVVGANDCAGDAPIDDISHKLTQTQTIHHAKTMVKGGSVKVSSILPCLNNTKVQAKIDEVNSAAYSICNELKVEYIQNDPSFRLADGDVNEGFYTDDGKHLNQAGSRKLAKTLKLEHKVDISMGQPWKSVPPKNKPMPPKQAQPASRKPPRLQQKAPCYNCGENNHTSNICKFRKRVTCYSCGAQGHKGHNCGNK